jgi:hypothetical protein
MQVGYMPAIKASPVKFAIGIVCSNLHKDSNRAILDSSAGVVALKIDKDEGWL